MRIKHWQGYGCINAKKLSEQEINNNTMLLTIELNGNHECGLCRYDTYDIFNWLLNRGKRFATKCKSDRNITNIEIDEGTTTINGSCVDQAIYKIYYRKE